MAVWGQWRGVWWGEGGQRRWWRAIGVSGCISSLFPSCLLSLFIFPSSPYSVEVSLPPRETMRVLLLICMPGNCTTLLRRLRHFKPLKTCFQERRSITSFKLHPASNQRGDDKQNQKIQPNVSACNKQNDSSFGRKNCWTPSLKVKKLFEGNIIVNISQIEVNIILNNSQICMTVKDDGMFRCQ